MECESCGAVVEPGEKFCGECGAPVVEKKPVYNANPSYSTAYTSLPDFIVDPTESIIARIGGDIPINLLVGQNVASWMACVTDRRVYFRGRMYSGTLRKPEVTVDSKVVDLLDVTGTGFIFSQISIFALIINIIIAIAGAIASIVGIGLSSSYYGVGFGTILIMAGVVILAVGIIGFIRIWLSRQVYFSIEYPGGIIFVDARLFPIETIDDFNKQIRRAKDRVREKNV